MEYERITEMAERLGVSRRTVQYWAKEGRLPGAVKAGRDWLIPPGLEGPAEIKQEEEALEKAKSEYVPLPLINTPFALGHCLEAVESIQDEALQGIARAEYHYFCGRATEAAREAELYLSHPDLSLRLSACLIYAYANLTTGRIALAKHSLQEVRKIFFALKPKDVSPEQYAVVVFIFTTANVLLHLPLPDALPQLQEFLQFLPPGTQMFSFYVQAHYLYLKGNYEYALGVVDTTFAVYGERYAIASLYLHLVAVMCLMSLKRTDQAREHFLAAWRLARQDKLFQALGEHHGLLGGMVEACLKMDHPEDFAEIIDITYNYSAGWRKVHNPDTSEEVADNLSTTEFAVAMLATRRWTNEEIARHMNLSVHTVKNYLSVIYQKLNVSNRKDLQKYMLR